MGNAADDRTLHTLSAQRIVILPDALFSGTREHSQKSVGLTLHLNFAEIGLEAGEITRRNEVSHRLLQDFLDAVTQQMRGQGIDGKKSAL
jgi:hypothetical protein